ncbi:hypothetical protein AB6F20_07585 [Providencia hangzhouensis]
MPEGTRHSIQFFDKYGDSLHRSFPPTTLI